MTVNEQVRQMAKELFYWEGRYGAHDGLLCEDLDDKDQAPYLEEALFLRNEFFLRQILEEIKKCEMTGEEIFAIGHNELDYVHTTPNSQLILDKFLRENERLFRRLLQAHTQKIIKRLGGNKG